jgi:hypothetical protein
MLGDLLLDSKLKFGLYLKSFGLNNSPGVPVLSRLNSPELPILKGPKSNRLEVFDPLLDSYACSYASFSIFR